MPKKIRLGIINSNIVKIGPYTKKGTEIFSYIFTSALAKRYSKEISITSFCSGNSLVPTKKEFVLYQSSTENSDIGKAKNNIFDVALVSRAIKMQKSFDIFHANVGAEYIYPLAQFTKKPIIVTLHGVPDEQFAARFFGLYKNCDNVHFVAISNMQKKYKVFSKARMIYHGIDIEKRFLFNPSGGNTIIWAGRAIPDKGPDEVLSVSKKLKIPAKIFPVIKSEYIEWLHREVLEKRDIINQITRVHIDFNTPRNKLALEYQNSRVFLFPLRWEEPFGFTVVESMASGTPVVAYAKGAMPELVEDGKTGYLVNTSSDDIRGDFIVKKTGFEGLCEAVQRIYNLPEAEYKAMRLQSRQRVERYFSVNSMVDNYVALYRELLGR